MIPIHLLITFLLVGCASFCNSVHALIRFHGLVPRREIFLSRLYTTTSTGPDDMMERRRMGELTQPEQKVYDLMQAIHDSKISFRVVVVGKGAILETTSELGPVMRLTQSPSTGSNLITFASEDQSFEFHLQLANVYKIVLTKKETPMKILRIVRFLIANGETMCSLILADESEEAVKWYEYMIAKFGDELQL